MKMFEQECQKAQKLEIRDFVNGSNNSNELLIFFKNITSLVEWKGKTRELVLHNGK